MELGRRGVVFDNRIVFDVSATGFDNLTFGSQPRPDPEQLEVQPGMAAEAGFDNPMYGTLALQEGFGVPSAEMIRPPPSRLDSLPLVSKVAGMLRSLRFNVATQKLEQTPGDVTGTGSDPNDNDKAYDDDQPLPVELGYDVPSTAADGKSARKKRTPRKAKKSERQESDVGEKHHRMEEESTDSDEDLTGKTARKLAKQMSEKGFGNPSYELGTIDGQPVTTATTKPTSESTTAAAATVRYRTGFANPMFEETEKAQVTLKDADTGDSHD